MTATVTEALFTAQSKLPLALKRDAEAIGYRYMTLDQLIAATRPILNGHGLSITQWPTTVAGEDGGLRPALRTRITFDPDGSYVEDTMPLYLHEKSMQALGAAITYARRYAWAAALGIAAEEDTDFRTGRHSFLMATVVHVNGEPVSYETEANAGIFLSTGVRWWGTLIKWRRGTAGKWNRVNAVDVHPFDTEAVEAALTKYVMDKS